MANSVPIPQDIIDNIIEAVDDDRYLLENCALVSFSFLLPSRKRLFSEISLGDNCQRLHQFLIENPVIQSFVRRIAITNPKNLKSHSLIAILRLPFCCLERFSVGYTRGVWRHSYWNDLSSELKDALSTLIHSPTLKTLSLESVSCIPATFFHGIHLMKLKLDSFFLDDFDTKQSSLLTSAASEGVTTTVSHTVVDRCVWCFYESMRGPTEPIYLPFMSRLRVFEIRATANATCVTITDLKTLSFLMRSLRLSLTSPATLEQLKFDIAFEGNDNDFNHDSDFYDDVRDAGVWSHLDSIITHPTGSRLQRVDINITLRYDNDWIGPDETEIMQPVLDALPLLREKGILFIEARKIPNYYW